LPFSAVRVSDGGETSERDMPLEMDVMDPCPDATWEQAWTITGKLLSELRDTVAASEAQLVAVVVPPHMIVDYDTWSWRHVFEPSERPLDLWYPPTRMLTLLSDLSIPALDPLQTFVDFRDRTGQSSFYMYDRHFNPAGTCLFGASVSAWLTEAGYVGQRGE